jgi:hypothetical protein
MRRSLFAAAPMLLAGALLSGCSDTLTSNNANLNCDRVHSISLGSSVSGSLDTGDCQLNDGSAVDYYRFRITTPRTVYVTQQSGTIDPYVAILDEFGNVVAEESNGGGGYSEISGIYLSEGTYYIAAGSYAAGDYGSYQLDTNYQ